MLRPGSVSPRGHDRRGPRAYWITLCAQARQPLFGRRRDGTIVLNRLGRAVEDEWRRVVRQRSGPTLDRFVVMPDQFHGLLWMAPRRPSLLQRVTGRRHTRDRVAAIVERFKRTCTARIRKLLDDPGAEVWQPAHYLVLVRDPARLDRLRRYMRERNRGCRPSLTRPWWGARPDGGAPGSP